MVDIIATLNIDEIPMAEIEVDMGAYPAAVRATVVQASSIFHNTPATLDKAERLVAEAAELGSQFVVFPEVFVGGYPRGNAFGNRSAAGRENYRKYHASAINVPGLFGQLPATQPSFTK